MDSANPDPALPQPCSVALAFAPTPNLSRPVGLIGILLVLLLVSEGVLASSVFRIKNRTYGNLVDPALTAQIDELFDSMESQVNGSLTQFDAQSFLKGTANSTALASTGGTHDLAHRFRYFFVSVGGGLAADLGGKNFSDLAKDPEAARSLQGLSGSMNLTIGAPGAVLRLPNLGWFDPQKSKFYLTFSQFNRSFDDVQFNYSTQGLMAQYRFFEPQSHLLGAVKWYGLDVTTGIKYTRLKLLFSKSFNETLEQQLDAPDYNNPTLTMSYSSTAQLGASADITTIPLEVTTSGEILYFLKGFIGLGTDLNWGSAKSIIAAPGTVTAQEPSEMLGTMGGDIEFDLGQTGKPQTFNTRTLMGVGMDFRVVSLVVQYNRNLSNQAQSYYLGLGAHF